MSGCLGRGCSMQWYHWANMSNLLQYRAQHKLDDTVLCMLTLLVGSGSRALQYQAEGAPYATA